MSRFIHAIERARRYPRLGKDREPLRTCTLQQNLLDVCNAFSTMRTAGCIACKLGAPGVGRITDCMPESFPDCIRAQTELQRLICRIKALIDCDHAIASPGRGGDLAGTKVTAYQIGRANV